METTMPTAVLKRIKGDKLADFFKRKVEPDSIYTIKFDLIKIKEEATKEKPQQNISQAKKGKWAEIVERVERESPLKGKSEEVVKLVRQFRDNFTL